MSPYRDTAGKRERERHRAERREARDQRKSLTMAEKVAAREAELGPDVGRRFEDVIPR
jgi:hypothetical protein